MRCGTLVATDNRVGENLAVRLRLDKRRDKTRHRRRDIPCIAHQMDRAKFRLRLRREMGVDPGAQLFARLIDIQQPDQRNDPSPTHAIPVRARLDSLAGVRPVSSSTSRAIVAGDIGPRHRGYRRDRAFPAGK